MIDLKALLTLLVVGQLDLSTAGRRQEVLDPSETPSTNFEIEEYILPQLLKDTEVEEDVEKFKNHLIRHRDAPVPAGELPISNRRSHEVGQYVLIVRNMIATQTALAKDINYFLNLPKAIEDSFGESMSKYADDYKGKLQPAIDSVTQVQDALEPIFKLIADLSKEADPSQHFKMYKQYESDNKPNGKKLLNLLNNVHMFLKDVTRGPISEEDALVEEGAGRFVMRNIWNHAYIAQSASTVQSIYASLS